ncbi:short-chain oxidoreductase [Colletotrichum tofieldiae]|nr:short-chain oxidoreductase [Colletotrichum tofieldiae]
MEACFRTNFHGPLNITRAFLPFLRERGTGTLVYLSSQVAWHVDISAGAYCASKFALEGAVETLAQELAILAPGLKVLLVEPGFSRTKVFHKIADIPPRVPEFAGLHAMVRAGAEAIPGTEVGDPEKAVARIVELVRGDGMAAGREVPLRVALGSDGWGRIREKCETVVRVGAEWEDVARSTDW